MRIVKLKGMKQVNGLHYSPDGRRLLAVGGYEVWSIDEARWVDVIGGTETLRVLLDASSYAVSPDLTRLALAHSDATRGLVSLPEVVTFEPTDSAWHEEESRWREIQIHLVVPNRERQVNALAVDNTGERFGIAFSMVTADRSRDDAVRHYIEDAYLSEPNAHVTGVDQAVSGVVFSPDGTFATIGGERQSVVTVRGANRRHIPVFPLPTSHFRDFTYSPNGDTLAVTNAKNVLLLPPDLSAPRLTLAHPKQVNAVAFTPDGRRVLTTSTDKLVRVWDVTTGQLVTSYDWNVGVTNAIAVAPDGLTAAVSGQSGRVVLFDLEG